MICPRCANAADHRLGPGAHCTSVPGPASQCDCQHRPPRRTDTAPESLTALPLQPVTSPA